MTWRGQLVGESIDLSTLAEVFPDGDPAVVMLSNKYWLEASASVVSAGTVDFANAKVVLQQMNGAARVRDTSYVPVSLTGMFENTEAGVLIAPPMAFGSINLFGRGQLRVGVPQRGDQLLAQAASDSDVRDALRVLGTPARLLTWADLYKVYEIIKQSVGSEKRMIRKGWATGAELDSFGLSSNHPAISGDDARHARQPGTPSHRKAMSTAEGQELVLRLAAMWTGER